MRRAVDVVDVAARERRKRRRGEATTAALLPHHNNGNNGQRHAVYVSSNERPRVMPGRATTRTSHDDNTADNVLRASRHARDGGDRHDGVSEDGDDSSSSVASSSLWEDDYVMATNENDNNNDSHDDGSGSSSSAEDEEESDVVAASSPPNAATHTTTHTRRDSHHTTRTHDSHSRSHDNDDDADGVGADDDDDSDHDAVAEVMQRRLRSIAPVARQGIAELRRALAAYATAEKSVDELLRARQAAQERLRADDEQLLCSDTMTSSSSRRRRGGAVDVVRLNVGGEAFVVPVATLLARDATHSYFAAMLSAMRRAAATTTTAAAASSSSQRHATHGAKADDDGDEDTHNDDDDDAAVTTNAALSVLPFTDASGAIFLDRDPDVFRCVLHYLRGYTHFAALDDGLVRRLRHDAHYFQLPGLLELLGSNNNNNSNNSNNSSSSLTAGLVMMSSGSGASSSSSSPSSLHFLPGPGVNPERNRLRVVYGIATVGDTALVTGCHRIHYEIVKAEYVGVGIVSDVCTCSDQEFHKTANCCVYYMSGVFYSNFPHHRKEENLERMEDGHVVTVTLDLDKGIAEFTLRNSSKLVSIGNARKLRFAVAMKLASRVRIVDDAEAQRLRDAQLQSEQETAAAAAATTASAMSATAATTTTTFVPPLAPTTATTSATM